MTVEGQTGSIEVASLAANADHSWQWETIDADLTRWAGEDVIIRMEFTPDACAPSVCTGGWPLWLEPRLVQFSR